MMLIYRKKQNELKANWVWGWHVFESVLNYSSRQIFKIQVLRQHIQKLNAVLKDKWDIPIEIVDRKYLDSLYGRNHQGIALQVSQIKFLTLKEWVKKQSSSSLLVVCDLLEDSQNLGAIIRTSKALGANGLLVTNNKSAPFNGYLAKAAAGALECFDIIEVVNLASSLENLKSYGYTIYGLDHRGQSAWTSKKRSVIVLGQEGSGLRSLTKKKCDHIISIYTQKDFAVLNVSVAAGIIIAKFMEGERIE